VIQVSHSTFHSTIQNKKEGEKRNECLPAPRRLVGSVESLLASSAQLSALLFHPLKKKKVREWTSDHHHYHHYRC
jgi:hypothetical protein